MDGEIPVDKSGQTSIDWDVKDLLPSTLVKNTSSTNVEPRLLEADVEVQNPDTAGAASAIEREPVSAGKTKERDWGASFKIKWIRTDPLFFHRTNHLRNQWNDDVSKFFTQIFRRYEVECLFRSLSRYRGMGRSWIRT